MRLMRTVFYKRLVTARPDNTRVEPYCGEMCRLYFHVGVLVTMATFSCRFACVNEFLDLIITSYCTLYRKKRLAYPELDAEKKTWRTYWTQLIKQQSG